jgi:DNA-binding HxlR family transcriptional regulator
LYRGYAGSNRKRAVGNVSDKVLIQQLKELRADGVVEWP